MTDTFNHFSQIGDKLAQELSRLVLKTAFDLEARAKTKAPVDTGALKNSIGVVEVSGYEADVVVTVDYAAYVEYGTYKMAAQPYLTPAIEEVRPAFNAALAKLGDNLKGSIG